MVACRSLKEILEFVCYKLRRKIIKLLVPFKEQLRAKIEELELCSLQIYKSDESRLFCKLLLNKPYLTLNEKSASGKKKQKRGITLFACTYATGGHN